MVFVRRDLTEEDRVWLRSIGVPLIVVDIGSYIEETMVYKHILNIASYTNVVV